MNRSRGAWWRVLAVLAALGLLAAACGGDDDEGEGGESAGTSLLPTEGADEEEPEEDTPEPVRGGSISVGLEADSNTFVPGPAQLASPGLMVAGAIYDPLVGLNAEGDFEGFLAESVEPNDDLTEWTVTLREGVLFHDGTPLDAEALLWNFEELHFGEDDQTRGTLLSAGVEGMEVVDPLTVRYNLSEPNAGFPDLLRLEAGWPVSPTAYQNDPEGFVAKPIGTGPFMMQEYRKDDRAVVVRNENYWMTDENGEQLPYLDQITFLPIPDEDARVNSLSSGTVDMVQSLRGLNVKQVLALVDEGGYDANIHVGNTAGSAILNVLVPPLDDVRVRTALALAGDSLAVQKVLGDDGLTEPSTGFFSQDSPWYSEVAAAAYPAAEGRDLEGAIDLIEQYKADPGRSDNKAVGDPVTVEYNCPPDPSLRQVSQLQQVLWGEAGVEVGLNAVEQAAHITNAVGNTDTNPPYAGDYIINCWRAGGGEGDPLTALQAFFGPVETTPGNFTNYTNSEIDEQLEILKTSPDFETRYNAVERIGVISGEEVPILWSSATPTVVGYVDTLFGVKDWTLPSGSPGPGTPGSVARFHQVFLAE